ncbi:hypothetical protein VTI28DRAFT_1796 [Corynascus sepedonium]
MGKGQTEQNCPTATISTSSPATALLLRLFFFAFSLALSLPSALFPFGPIHLGRPEEYKNGNRLSVPRAAASPQAICRPLSVKPSISSPAKLLGWIVLDSPPANQPKPTVLDLRNPSPVHRQLTKLGPFHWLRGIPSHSSQHSTPLFSVFRCSFGSGPTPLRPHFAAATGERIILETRTDRLH